MDEHLSSPPPEATARTCLSRRDFFAAGGKALATSVVLLNLPGLAEPLKAQVSRYPRKRIARVAQLRQDVPRYFKYPDEGAVHAASMLVKLGRRAGAGVGEDEDIVAFSTLCTHMGGPLHGTYKPEYKAIGPCPFHLTTFDLTRHGMVIAGHATQSLPQVTLEVEEGEIFATGVLGLIYGRADNLQA